MLSSAHCFFLANQVIGHILIPKHCLYFTTSYSFLNFILVTRPQQSYFEKLLMSRFRFGFGKLLNSLLQTGREPSRPHTFFCGSLDCGLPMCLLAEREVSGGFQKSAFDIHFQIALRHGSI